MKKHLKYVEGTSDKFWEIEVSGLEYTVTYGKNGTSGISQTKSCATNKECIEAAEKLIAAKIKKGYSENGDTVINGNTIKKNNDKKYITDKYDSIIESRDFTALLPFLEENVKGNTEILKKHIQKRRVYYTTFIQVKSNGTIHYEPQGDTAQIEIIILSGIALLNKSEVNSRDDLFSLLNRAQEPHILEILKWSKPNWIEGYLLDRIKKEDWRTFNYTTLRFLEEQSLINFNSELYALSLAGFSEWSTKIKISDLVDIVLNDEKTYKRDVPELFNYQTNLHYNNFRIEETENTYGNTWSKIFNILLDEKKLNRNNFVQDSLLIQTKDWNNNLKSFFRKFLTDMNLETDELILQQEVFFTFLQHQHPPIVNFGIELIKKVFDHSKFKNRQFIEWIEPLMMRSDCKGGIKTTLTILEKLARQKPVLKENIALVVADVFVIPDLSLQEKAAKILLKLASQKNTQLVSKLSDYSMLMQGTVKLTLSSLMNIDIDGSEADFTDYHFNPTKEEVLTDPVNLPETWNDIVWQFGNFISSSDIIDSEILLNVFITQRHLFPNDYSKQLTPYQKQLDTYFESVQKTYVRIFLNYKIENIKSGFLVNDKDYNSIKTLAISKSIVQITDRKILKNSILPLLSFPTHKPYWIAPKTLLERIIAYQNSNENIDLLDLSIAISRMPNEQIEEAIPLLSQIKGDLKDLLAYVLGMSETIKLHSDYVFNKLFQNLGTTTKAAENNALWAVAARTRNPQKHLNEFSKTFFKNAPFVENPYNPELTITKKSEWKSTKLNIRLPKPEKIPHNLLYSLDTHLYEKNWYNRFNGEENVYYWFSLIPQNSDPLALCLLEIYGAISEGPQAELKGYLNAINSPGFNFTNNSLLLFCCCFFYDKKDLRFMATELLINFIEKQKLDVTEFSKKIAFLASNNYGPFLRLVESLVGIKDVSPLHNSALFQIIEGFFANFDLNEKLPVNFKKMVENYLDLLTKINTQPSVETISFFNRTNDYASLKPLIKQILNIPK